MKHIGIVNLTLGNFDKPVEKPVKNKVCNKRRLFKGKKPDIHQRRNDFQDLMIDSSKNRKRISQINERIESLKRLASIEHLQVGDHIIKKKKKENAQKENMFFMEEEEVGVNMAINTHKKEKKINNIEDVFKETPCDKKIHEPETRIEKNDNLIKQLFLKKENEEEIQKDISDEDIDEKQRSEDELESLEAVSIISNRDVYENSFEDIDEEGDNVIKEENNMTGLFIIEEAGEQKTECINRKNNNYISQKENKSKLEKKLIQSIYKEKLFRKLNREREIKNNIQDEMKSIFGD